MQSKNAIANKQTIENLSHTTQSVIPNTKNKKLHVPSRTVQKLAMVDRMKMLNGKNNMNTYSAVMAQAADNEKSNVDCLKLRRRMLLNYECA